jgi:hypothetical protein
MTAEGRAFLFSFPFWLTMDRDSLPEVIEQEYGDAKITIYPPFRSAANNFVGMPDIKAKAIPFKKEVSMNISDDFKPLTLAAHPSLPASGKESSVVFVWGQSDQDAKVDMPMDSLRLDVVGDAQQGHLFLEQFLVRLRVMSRQWWIGRSIAGIFGYTRNEFSIGPFGVPKELPIGAVRFTVVGTDQQKIDADLWSKAIAAAINNDPVNDSVLMNLDAKYYLSLGDLSACIMNLANACENAKDLMVEAAWRAKNPGAKFKRGKVLTGYDLPDHITDTLGPLTSRDLAKERPGVFQRIEDIWDARGSVAHGAKPSFRREGQLHVITPEIAHELIQAGDEFLRWIDGPSLSITSPGTPQG